jgi:DNA-binding transcriptional ArsR family regulator
MDIDFSDENIAISKLMLSLVRKIFRDGKIDVDSCNKITSHIHNFESAIISFESPTESQIFESLPDISNLHSRIQMPGRSSYRILHYLMSNHGSWYTVTELGEILGYSPGSMRVHISALRKKLGELGLEDVVNTRYGVGYCINRSGVDKVMSILAMKKPKLN